jgi:hypothetical protein
MKQFKVVIPVKIADAFATYLFANEIRTILSWGSEDFFSGSEKITVICAATDEKAAEFAKGDYKQYLKN